MSVKQIIGLVLVIVGFVVAVMAFREMNTFAAKVARGVTGHANWILMAKLIGGAVIALAGGAMLYFYRKR
jgi:hypothetical protein